MSLVLQLLAIYTPPTVRYRALDRLISATANAFGVPAPKARTQSYTGQLQAYAEFTAAETRKALSRAENIEYTSQKLFNNALMLGEYLRKSLRVTSEQDVMAAAHLVYKAIEIDLQGSPSGDIIISRCYFSRFYSPEICRLIGNLDAGILAGLSGGQRLEFTQRITEGSGCCRAKLFRKDAKP